MFRLDYVFQDGGPRYQESYPDKDINSNFFIIHGSNDQGKTTSLNMIALGLYGNRLFKDDMSNIIPDTLKAKMDYFQSGKLDEIAFNFEIVSKDSNTKIISEFNNNKIKVKMNDRDVGPDEFIDSIQLLYDIPDDPIIKLNSSIKLIRDHLIEYSKYLDRYKDKIKNIHEKINDFNQKEEKKIKLLKKIQDDKYTLSVKQEQLKIVNDEIEKYRKYAAVHKFFEFNNEIDIIDSKIKELKAVKTNLSKKGIGGRSAKFKEQIAEYDSNRNLIINDIKQALKYQSVLSVEDQKVLNSIKKGLEKGREPGLINDKDVENWFSSIELIISNLNSNDLAFELKDEREQSELIDKLLEVLREHLGNSFKIPGTEKESVFQFYKELDEYNKQLKPKISKINSINIVVDKLGVLKKTMKDFDVQRRKLPKVDDTDHQSYEKADKQIRELTDKKDSILPKSQEYCLIIEHISDDEIQIILEEPCIEDELKNRENEKKNLERDISNLNKEIPGKEGQVKGLEAVSQPPDYSEEWLKNQYDMCDNLLRKFEKWKKTLGTINLKQSNLGIDYESSEQFLDILSQYFADILKEIHFEQKPWRVLKVDLFERQYVVEGRKPIKFVQMGTGHTALNSILSRIKQKFSNKKKILLIDEVGHMDERNIGILKDEIIRQIDNNETILAVMTIADNNVDRTTWEAIH